MDLKRTRREAAALVAALALAASTGCGAADDASTAGSDRLAVVASFYPLAFVAAEVGGDRVDVSNLTRPGAEPHDLELTPADVATTVDADLTVYLGGFQPAVDDAVAQAANPEHTDDVAPVADLSRTVDGGAVDPHFWLDPKRLAAVATSTGQRLAAIDPSNATEYRQRARALVGRLDALDAEFVSGLAPCRQRQLVTSHAAFGYLADRYGFSQLGITGLSPETEPSPAALATAADRVRADGVTTIYFETLAPPDIAKTVASETGATTAVLDPLEGLSDDSDGADYFSVMRTNLATLRTGQGCT